MSRPFCLMFIGLTLLFSKTPCFAAEQLIRPQRAFSVDQYATLSATKEHSDGSVKGKGSVLDIAYSSTTPLHAFIAILDKNGSYNPFNQYAFDITPGTNTHALIDLTVLANWNLREHDYFLSFLSETEGTDAVFSGMSFRPSSMIDLIHGALKQLGQNEPFWVSSAHLLRGYMILGVPYSVIIGILAVVGSVTLLVCKKREVALACLLFLMLFYSMRFLVNQLMYTKTHLTTWTRTHSYGEPRDIYSAADALIKDVKKDSPKSPAVSVCFDSTDYYAKLIRYVAYPIPVTLTGTLLPTTSHVIVTHKIDWNYEDGVLTCEGIKTKAIKLQSWNDGTVLFSLPKQ